MKGTIRGWGFVALAAMIGFFMAGCKNPSDGGSEDALAGTVSISGTAEVGETLTAVTTDLEGSGTISYQWKRIDAGGTDAVVGTNSSTYVIQAADADFAITVTVTRAGYFGSKTSEPTATVTDPNAPPLAGTVSISGEAIVGQTLTAITTALEGSGTISYQWKRIDAGGTDAVVGTNNSTYVIQAADVGSTITVTVTRSGNSGSKESAATAIVALPALSGTVSISGEAIVGQTLTAITTALGGTGTISCQWKRIDAGGTDAVVGTNSSTYVIQAADAGFAITVTVTRAGYSGSKTSELTATVAAQPGTLNISITAGGDASISGSALIVDGVLTLSRSSTPVTITLANADTYDTGSIRWRVQGTAISGSEASFALNASNPAYLNDKQYFVTVEASRNGVPFDFTFTFVVEG
jgi:hypothetical protein